MMFVIVRLGRHWILSFGIETQRQTVPAMGIQKFGNKNLVHVVSIDVLA
jgi:hypothetical protein